MSIDERDVIHARFVRETAEHKMTVLHDDGLYRHLRFMREYWQVPWKNVQRSGMYWFEIVTAPGVLIFNGDGESFTFRRVEDMFEFFRGPVGRINPDYWAEKITDGRDRAMRYDPALFAAHVKTQFVEAARNGGVPAGTGLAIREAVLDPDVVNDEHMAIAAAFNFDHRGFGFPEPWEWRVRAYDWWFLWALHGIVWGIAQYDAHHGRSVQVAGSESEPVAVSR